MKNIQTITIDINKRPFQSLTANTGEIASRFIRINIIDNGLAVDLTGVSLYLYAKKADGTKVFNTITVEDALKGTVLAELTSQVLAVSGIVKLTLLLVKEGSKLCSKQFLVSVDSCIVDDEAIESTNEFTGLIDALGRVNNIDSRFGEVNSQLEQKATREEVYLKRDKTTPLMLSDLHTEVKTAITGGSVAVVGENAVGSENVKKLSIQPIHTSFIKIANILALYSVETGKYMNTDGTMIASANYNTLQDVGLETNTIYTFYGNGGNDFNKIRNGVIFDNTGAISRVIDGANKFTTTANEVKISFSFNKLNTDYSLKKEKSEFDELKNVNIDSSLLINKDNAFGINDVDFISKPINVLKNITPQSSKYVNTDGTIIESGMYNSFIQLELEENESYTVKNITENYGIRAIAFYNSSMVMTRRIENVNTSFSLNIGEKYVSLSVNKSGSIEIFKGMQLVNILEDVKIKESDIIYEYKKPQTETISFFGKGRRPLVSFILDGEYDMNDDMETIFSNHNVKVGFAPQYVTSFSNNSISKYLEWQEKGHEILSHATYILNDSAAYTLEEGKEIIKNSHNILTEKGFIINGIIGSSGLIADRYMPYVRKYYQYGATLSNVSNASISYVKFGTNEPYRLFRYSIELSTLEEMKNAVDQSIQNNGLLIFYGHAKTTNNNNFTTSNLDSLLSYIETKEIEIMPPFKAIKDYYAIRYEDIFSV